MFALLLSAAFAAPADLSQPLPVIVEDGKVWVVLVTEAAPEWAATKPALLARPSPTSGTSVVGGPARGGPPTHTGLTGRAVTLADEDSSCTGTLGAPQVITRMSWMDGFADFEGDPACASPGKACDARILQATLEQSAERLLVAPVSGCADFDGQAVASLTPTALGWGAEPKDVVLSTSALAHFAALPEWQAVQQAYTTDGSLSNGPYWTVNPTVREFRLGDHLWVVVSETTGGCGDFDGALWAAWEVRDDTWQLLPRDPAVRPFYPQVLADPDGDGMPTLYGWSDQVVPDGGKLRQGLNWESPWMGCAC